MTMATNIEGALARMRTAIERLNAPVGSASRDDIEKTLWSSPAGKRRIAKRLAGLLPAHKTYVEPFAGSAAVLFAKEPAAVEAINDFDPDIAKAYRLIQKADASFVEKLRGRSWKGDKTTFLKLYDAEPTGDVDWLHRFLYVTHFSYGKLRGRSFSPVAQGVEASTVDRIAEHAPRLKRVKVYDGDYEKVVRKYDAKDTAYFLDPPYAGYDANVGEKKFDEARFLQVLKDLKGKWLLTYGIRGTLPKALAEAGFTVKRIRTPRTIRSMRGVGGSSVLTQILASNYEQTAKSLAGLSNDEIQIDDWDGQVEDEFRITGRVLKAEDRGEQRFVLGVVLEPETVDAQEDIYSAEEVRKVAHRFLEEFRGLGLMHQVPVNGQVKIVESYVALDDMRVGGEDVKKGTWLLGVHVLSDELWAKVKSGDFTGFSIGGSARRYPERAAGEEGHGG
jgi:DNA adenine methylase